eukprot:scaffold39173_cov59-Phaeocystis_antarctica.AAC.2
MRNGSTTCWRRTRRLCPASKRKAYNAGRGAEWEVVGRGGGSGASGAHGKGPTEGWGPGHARSAPAYEARRGVGREAGGRGSGVGASGAQAGLGPTEGWGTRARAERT